MWVFTRKGFYSVVAYDPKQDKETKSPFKKIAKSKFTHVLVRARVKEDLEDLRKVVPNVKVVDDVIADYKYRAVISRRQWKKFLDLAVDDIDYDSHFKEVMRAGDKHQPQARYEAVSKVWSAMIQLQPVGAWASSGTTPTGGWGYGSGVTTFGKSEKSAYSNVDLDAWLEERAAEEEAAAYAEEEDAALVDDNSPLDIRDVRSYILCASDKYPDFLTESEVARATEAGFELWVRVMEDRKKIGKANLNVDEDYLDSVIEEIRLKHYETTPESEWSREFADVPEGEDVQEPKA
jgi:hypothetical protein